MDQNIFTDEDLYQIKQRGLSIEDVQKQIEQFKTPPPHQKLLRPCKPGDGIEVLDQKVIQAQIETYDREAPERKCVKFTPASGVASRMFRILLQYLSQEKEISKEQAVKRAQAGDKAAQELLVFMNGIRRFAFFGELKSVMSKASMDIEDLISAGQFSDIIRFLMKEQGLGCDNLPKGLIKFHTYRNGTRTAFEEHILEACNFIVDKERKCSLHFTISRKHQGKFISLLKQIRPIYENRYGVKLRVDFSFQKESTDTIAVDLNNDPFREKDGKLLFRPGGHGSLIENLNDIQGDIVFLKNIDNVVPDRLKNETFNWKKVLGGRLINIQKEIFNYLRKLSKGATDPSFFEQVTVFMEKQLYISIPTALENLTSLKKKELLMERLNRPIRVCGMVKNVGEPGGGPFWVKDISGETSLQIVEMTQVDRSAKDQEDILNASSYFNPVDIVCGVRNFKGEPFDLRQYVDVNTIFISEKSKEGKDLKALEHPGLWNGAMARWITLFVEVPAVTFNPVKTVNDLLREEHQPG